MILSIVAVCFAGKAIYNAWADDVPEPKDITDSTDSCTAGSKNSSTAGSKNSSTDTTSANVNNCRACNGEKVTNNYNDWTWPGIKLSDICPINEELFIEHFNSKESEGISAKCLICQKNLWNTATEMLFQLTKNKNGNYIFKENNMPLIRDILKDVELVHIIGKVNGACHLKCLADQVMAVYKKKQ